MSRAKASKAKAAKPKRAPVPPVELSAPASDQALVDRYYAMAEELNGRGSMELAVPFYRQTIALLLAEREQLLARQGQEPVALPSSEDVDGVMAAAASVDSALTEAELLRQLTALEEELSPQNQQEVAAALEVLQEQWGQPHPQLLALIAKLHLVAGNLEQARGSFEQALSLDGDCVRLRLNTGAVRLAVGDSSAALQLLRPLAQLLEQPHPRGTGSRSARARGGFAAAMVGPGSPYPAPGALARTGSGAAASRAASGRAGSAAGHSRARHR